jgi:hypothetical protein
MPRKIISIGDSDIVIITSGKVIIESDSPETITGKREHKVHQEPKTPHCTHFH